ncbi:MAG TPA: D-alanine--D-alanine ligase [Candidatus Binatia bacterium]|nr:D-alanine--D-alanine ligase [Candidatus Binatia bacterium]
MRKLRVLVLMHPSLVPPDSLEGYTEKEIYLWKTEYDVVTTLRKLGHEVKPLGVQDELMPIRTEISEWKPHIVYNLLEEFHGVAEFDHHVVSYLELLQTRYTGCNPRGLVLARDKALSKKLLVYHRVRVPNFTVIPLGLVARHPRRLTFPLIVKSLTKEASLGISQASIIDSDEKLAERVRFIHESRGTAAIVEQFIDGRELYVGVLGNRRLEVLPVWELTFENMPPGSATIATARVKHDPEYQRKRGIYQQPAVDLPPALTGHIVKTSKRIFRILELDGYVRIDYRLSPKGELYFLEANPNPEVAESEEFASAAQAAGISYPALLQKIINLGLQRER